MSRSASIIICTCNRAPHLRQTLDSLARVVVPDGLACELLVVDNGSTDGTAELVRDWRLPQMPVRSLQEPRPGQCRARNLGMAAARGELILFTDDDVRFPADWVAGMVAPLLAGRADAVAGGVRIAPHLLRPWMSDRHRKFLASTEGVGDAGPISLVGANMAFRRDVLSQVPGFDVELGPGALGFNDETLFSQQLRTAGYRFASAYRVEVEHHFDPSRLERRAFADRMRREGRSRAYVAYHWDYDTLDGQPMIAPRRQWLLALAHLGRWRLQNRAAMAATEGMAEGEMYYLHHAHLYGHFLRERRRPRNYDRHGLVKRAGLIELTPGLTSPGLQG